MDLFEAEGKALFSQAGIPINAGVLVLPGQEIPPLPIPCVVKAQVLGGKRKKAGGVRFPKNRTELESDIQDILSRTVDGKPVSGVLVTEYHDFLGEHYLAITVDTQNKGRVLIYSPEGGGDIERLAEEHPERLLRMAANETLDAKELTAAVTNFGVRKEIAAQVAQTAQKLLTLFLEKDLTTAEINPLAELTEHTLMAADAKAVIDDNALYRQSIPLLLPRGEDKSPAAVAAEEAGLAYVRLEKDGNIGIIAGGAGIGMITVDTVYYYGGKPFNFMDLGGGVTREKTCTALSLLLADKRVKGVLCNVFGGINNCLTMAEGFRDAILSVKSDAVVVVKSRGFSQEEGWSIYDKLGLGQVRYGTTDDAVKRLMAEMSKREENK